MMKLAPLLLAAASCHGFQPPASTSTVHLHQHNHLRSDFSPLRSSKATRLHAAADASAASAATTGLDAFDYKTQWYPVIWSRDLPFNQPRRVTLFDVNYVVAKTMQKKQNNGEQEEQEEVYVAMLDECPHKKVALSEGRVTDCGFIQCSYHGWTFDGSDGKCVEIPQTVIASAAAKEQQGKGAPSSSPPPQEAKRSREDGTAVAITEAQGMLWISPFLSPLEALAATSEGRLSPPPRVPEIDMPEYKTQIAVRDFPIDWTVLMENIMDPDHGYFAHSSSGTAPIGFDWYSSDGVENMMEVKEESTENGGWKIVSSVNAVAKLAKYNSEVRNPDSTKKKQKKKDEGPPKLATTTFVAPSLIYMGRRDNSTATSNFLTAFWVSPVGTGRSRFMSAAVSKAPFTIPRWIVHMQLNNFLDQDTFLLLGQHKAVLKREAEGHLEQSDSADDTETSTANNVRKSTYVYRSPSEKLPVKIGQFFDKTLSRVPNRKDSLMAWYNRNSKENKLFEPWPSRETVLDRYEQHTKICPDSQEVVNRCDRVMKRSKVIGCALILMKLVIKPQSSFAAATATATGAFELGSFALGFKSGLSILSSILSHLATSIANFLVQTRPFFGILATLFVSHSLAARIKREFFFKFTDNIHHEDIKFIANNWKDL
jgi:phenylpropionate dioxygenase-like ring-hydroxylating dioxygenase large terminal subunit